MKPTSKKTSAKNPADDYNQLVNELQDMAQPTHSTHGEDASRDITSLKSRAQQLLVWITRHKSHVDRHELADICKEGLKTIMKIMKVTGTTDTTELEFELMVLEARKTACEEAFAEDLKGFDNITPEIISSFAPELQSSIKARIAKAKSNIFTTKDTPEKLLDEIGGMLGKMKESRIDEIISQTLDTIPSFSLLRKSPILRDQLRKHIREHIEYTEVKALINQVNTLLGNRLQVYCIESFKLPDSLRSFISSFNNEIADLIRWNCNESQKFSRISINDFHPEDWSLDGSETLVLFKKNVDKYEELCTIRNDFFSNIYKLREKIKRYANLYDYVSRNINVQVKEKPSNMDMNSFRNYLREFFQINEDLNKTISNSGGLRHPDDRYLSYYNKKVDDLISKIS